MAPLTSCPPFRPPRCLLCRSILPSLEERSGSPTFTELLWLHATLSDPGGVPCSCPVSEQGIEPSRFLTLSASSRIPLTGLHRFNPKVCGLQPPCLRLTPVVTDRSPRLGMEYAGSALSQWHFQPPVVQHFVAHQKTGLRVWLGLLGELPSFPCPRSRGRYRPPPWMGWLAMTMRCSCVSSRTCAMGEWFYRHLVIGRSRQCRTT